MKKYENLREFLADLVKYGKLYSENGYSLGLKEKSFEYDNVWSWAEMIDLAWSPTELLNDKDLVWCWDNDDTHLIMLKFYDLNYGSTFCFNGYRNGTKHDCYEKFTGEWPEWAKEAVKTLED